MNAEKTPIIVTIDGPSASGKSTVSKEVAKALNYVYVDSGSYYRGFTWKVLRDGIDVNDAKRVADLVPEIKWELQLENHVVTFRVDGEQPGEQLRSEPVRENVSVIASIPAVRDFLVNQFHSMTQFGNLVMEGRDIGSVVFPDAPFKYYLDASAEERARRRVKDIETLEGSGNEEKVLDSLRRRDQKDSSRETAPLQIPLGAEVIDTTSLSLEEVVKLILEKIRSL